MVLTIVVKNLQTIEARFAKLIHKMTAWSFKVIEQPLNLLVSPANFKNRLPFFFFFWLGAPTPSSQFPECSRTHMQHDPR